MNLIKLLLRKRLLKVPLLVPSKLEITNESDSTSIRFIKYQIYENLQHFYLVFKLSNLWNKK